MPKPRTKRRTPRRVSALPDLEQSKTAVLNSLTSIKGQLTNQGQTARTQEVVEVAIRHPRGVPRRRAESHDDRNRPLSSFRSAVCA